jgi:hypothetical protein
MQTQKSLRQPVHTHPIPTVFARRAGIHVRSSPDSFEPLVVFGHDKPVPASGIVSHQKVSWTGDGTQENC